MPGSVFGLPTHMLVIHAVVVLLPLTSALLVMSAFSARARLRAGVLLPLAGAVCLVLTPVATSSGEALQAKLPPNPQIQAHAQAGDALLPWAVALAVMSVAVWWFGRRAAGSAQAGASSGAVSSQRPVRELAARSPLSVGLAVLATVAAVGATVQVIQIGHLGARATWGYVAELPSRQG